MSTVTPGTLPPAKTVTYRATPLAREATGWRFSAALFWVLMLGTALMPRLHGP